MKYRREIDGLRALAVLPVILFHAGFSVFSGGYVGVDVFFVISGYLITAILIAEIEQEKFSIGHFYERRARRILPALFLVTFACLPFAYMWMLPSQMKDFSQSIVAVVFFASNILFWTEDRYFATTAEQKPLLHTWSLAVEEQYYLLFPIFLLALWRFGRQRVFWCVVVIALFSLLLAELGWRNKPSANFYLAPTRAWELLAGSICAFVTVGKAQRSNNALSAFGLTLIIFSMFAYNQNTPFPSFYALAPVVGTGLIIVFASQGTLVARLLSKPVFVGIGLISYSAYLWHQPLFAFARLRSLTEPGHVVMSMLAFASLVLAWATWYWIERPFRDRANPLLVTRRSVFVASGAVGAVFVAIGLSGHNSRGYEGRFDEDMLSIFDARVGDTTGCHNGLEQEQIEAGMDCRIGAPGVTPSIAVIGDSHASRLSDALSKLMTTRMVSAVTFNGSWCVPLANFATDVPSKNGCVGEINAALNQVMTRPELGTVVLHAQWANYIDGLRWSENSAAAYIYAEDGNLDYSQASVELNRRFFEMALDKTLSELTLAQKRIVIVLPVPEHHLNVREFASRAALLGIDANIRALSAESYEARAGVAREILLRIGGEFEVDFVDPYPMFCDDMLCNIVDHLGHPLYMDSNHLSYLGSLPVASATLELVLEMRGHNTN